MNIILIVDFQRRSLLVAMHQLARDFMKTIANAAHFADWHRARGVQGMNLLHKQARIAIEAGKHGAYYGQYVLDTLYDGEPVKFCYPIVEFV